MPPQCYIKPTCCRQLQGKGQDPGRTAKCGQRQARAAGDWSRPAPPLAPTSASLRSSLACSLCVSARRAVLMSWQLFSFQNLPAGFIHITEGGMHLLDFPCVSQTAFKSTAV